MSGLVEGGAVGFSVEQPLAFRFLAFLVSGLLGSVNYKKAGNDGRIFMKKRTITIIAVLAIIPICFSLWFVLSGHRPFKDLKAANVVSASVEVLPPDATIQIEEIKELVSCLNDVVIYNKDNSYTNRLLEREQ